ncbi:hypothetical protein KEM52_002184, partial [Ascosphaera acerosa]
MPRTSRAGAGAGAGAATTARRAGSHTTSGASQLQLRLSFCYQDQAKQLSELFRGGWEAGAEAESEYRKSQLERQYTSLIRTSPLLLFFQHNNLKATEWSAIRRELARALAAVDAEEQAVSDSTGAPAAAAALAPAVRLQNVQGGIFEAAVRVVEYFDPARAASGALTHDLSETAFAHAYRKKGKHPLTPVLLGPVGVLSFPRVSPSHLKAALRTLAPRAPDFPAPKRREVPAWHEPEVQAGLAKLSLLAARVDGELVDEARTRWIGAIPGGMAGLRAQLVAVLNMAGAQLAGTLEGAAKAL